jgi:hypothetical protein
MRSALLFLIAPSATPVAARISDRRSLAFSNDGLA